MVSISNVGKSMSLVVSNMFGAQVNALESESLRFCAYMFYERRAMPHAPM